jgi:hypothetical protein
MWRGGQQKQATEAASRRALQLGAEHILTEANDRVPHEYGDLMRSGDVDTGEDISGELAASISYDTPYAVMQHENLDLEHKNGREAKWLERTMNDEMDEVQAFMARELKEAH